MKTKRVYYPVNKAKIQEAIDLYNKYNEINHTLSQEEAMELWTKYCDTFDAICPRSNVWVLHIFQAMRWSDTLTVDNVYYAIIVMGANTKLVEVDDD